MEGHGEGNVGGAALLKRHFLLFAVSEAAFELRAGVLLRSGVVGRRSCESRVFLIPPPKCRVQIASFGFSRPSCKEFRTTCVGSLPAFSQ